MPGQILTNKLKELNFHQGAGGQWYRAHSSGNGDPSDNHTHLIGTSSTPGYDPVRNPKPDELLTVTDVEFKIRLTGQDISRVWLVRTVEGDFLMPHHRPGTSKEVARIARQLYDALPSELSAE